MEMTSESVNKHVVKIEKLQFVGLSILHDGGQPVLQNCSFDFCPGKVHWLMSDEGAGKTTVLNCIAALNNPSSGQYLINGVDVIPLSFEEFLPYRLSIGMSFDYGGLINNKTLRDNLLLPLHYHHLCTVEEAQERVDEIIKRFGVAKYASERPAMVPGRIRKMFVVMRAIIIKPSLLLLDDPAVGLSDDIIENFVDLIKRYRAEGHLNTVIMSAFDDRMLKQFDYDVIALEGMQLITGFAAEKKAVNV